MEFTDLFNDGRELDRLRADVALASVCVTMGGSTAFDTRALPRRQQPLLDPRLRAADLRRMTKDAEHRRSVRIQRLRGPAQTPAPAPAPAAESEPRCC
jgi:hypothetical protein